MRFNEIILTQNNTIEFGIYIDDLIDELFDNKLIFICLFEQYGYQISNLVINKMYHILLINDHLFALKYDNNYIFHLCAIWKLYNEII